MASGKICDRCGAFYKYNNVTTKEGRYITSVSLIDNKHVLVGRHDLCDKCVNDFFSFMGVKKGANDDDQG